MEESSKKRMFKSMLKRNTIQKGFKSMLKRDTILKTRKMAENLKRRNGRERRNSIKNPKEFLVPPPVKLKKTTEVVFSSVKLMLRLIKFKVRILLKKKRKSMLKKLFQS